jgi:hypothetical protein
LLRAVGEIFRTLRDPNLDRRKGIVCHAVGFVDPSVPSLIVPDLQPTAQDCAIAERLLEAYKRCVPHEATKEAKLKPDVWSVIRTLQAHFLELLDRNDPSALASYLCNMSRHDATTGTVQGDLEFKKISRDRQYRRFIALMTKDKL